MSDAADERIRILVLGLSQLVKEMLDAAFEDAEIDVFDSHTLAELADAVRKTRPDFVVVPLEGPKLPAEARRFLVEQAHVRVLGLEQDNGRAYLYELVPETTEIGTVTPVDLVAAIRGAAAAGTDV